MTEIESLGKQLTQLFRVGYKKLGPLGIINGMIILAFILYACVESFGNAIERLAVILSGRLLEWKGITPQPIKDNTPFSVYAFFLLAGLVLCLFILKNHYEKKLWPKND